MPSAEKASSREEDEQSPRGEVAKVVGGGRGRSGTMQTHHVTTVGKGGRMPRQWGWAGWQKRPDAVRGCCRGPRRPDLSAGRRLKCATKGARFPLCGTRRLTAGHNPQTAPPRAPRADVHGPPSGRSNKWTDKKLAAGLRVWKKSYQHSRQRMPNARTRAGTPWDTPTFPPPPLTLPPSTRHVAGWPRRGSARQRPLPRLRAPAADCERPPADATHPPPPFSAPSARIGAGTTRASQHQKAPPIPPPYPKCL